MWKCLLLLSFKLSESRILSTRMVENEGCRVSIKLFDGQRFFLVADSKEEMERHYLFRVENIYGEGSI